MADILIRLRFNLETGKKDIIIDYTSDDDALPIEHEQAHREFIGELLGKGILEPDEMGEVKVNRITPGSSPQGRREETAQPQKEGAGQS